MTDNKTIEGLTAIEWYGKGNLLMKIKLYKEATAAFSKAIDLAPNFALAFCNRGAINSRLGLKKEAIQDYNKAIHLDPNSAIYYYNRGVTKLDLRLNKDAIADNDITIQIDSNYTHAYYNRGCAKLALGWLQEAQYDYNRFLYLTDVFKGVYIFIFSTYTTPFLCWHTLQKFTDFENLELINPIVEETRQQCRPFWHFFKFLALKEAEKQAALQYYHTEALINFYMGDPIHAFKIYNEKIDSGDFKINLMGQYYFVESSKRFLEPHESILDFALEQIERDTPTLIAENDVCELYYAGQILYQKGDLVAANNYFAKAYGYLPAAFMLVLTLKKLGFSNNYEQKKKEVKERDNTEGRYLQGFPKQYLGLESENYFPTFQKYAHYQELLEAITEINTDNAPYEHNEMWDAFQWRENDIAQIEKLEREKDIGSLVQEMSIKFGENLETVTHDYKRNMEKLLTHSKRNKYFKGLKFDAKEGENMVESISDDIYNLQEDYETYSLIIRYFYVVDKKLTAIEAITLQSYNIYMNRMHNHKSEALEEGFVEGIQPVLGLVFSLLEGIANVVAGGISVVLKNTIKDVSIGGEKIIYEDFNASFLSHFSYLKETTGPKAFDTYFGVLGFKD
jgi:Tetratricopeptide repeat